MNIYKVRRTDGYSYDDYDSFVCVARNEEDARRIIPCHEAHEDNSWVDFSWDEETGNLVLTDRFSNDVDVVNLFGWVDNFHDLEVELIGQAVEGIPEGTIILTSFNAG